MLVIGLVGRQGSGKNTFVEAVSKFMPNKSLAHVKSGSILIEILKILSLPITRENLQALPQALKDCFGANIISRAIFERIINTKADIVFFDAVRWQSDVDMLRQFPDNLLVYIDTDKEVRYLRLKDRKEKEDENELPREQFEKAEIASTEVEIGNIGYRADVILINNGTEEDFYSRVKIWCGRLNIMN
jgi:dephospho-CoA kinase